MVTPSKSELFRLLPSVDELLRSEELQALVTRDGHAATMEAAREFLDRLRSQIAKGEMTEELLAMAIEDALLLAQQLCEDGLLLYSNAHRFWNDPGVMQGIWDLRDSFKATGRMLVLLAAPGATLPQELGQDVLILDEPLPSTSHLE